MLGGAGEIAGHAEDVAGQHVGVGRAGIGGLDPAGACQRLGALPAGEQSGDQANLGRPVAGMLGRRAAQCRKRALVEGIERR